MPAFDTTATVEAPKARFQFWLFAVLVTLTQLVAPFRHEHLGGLGHLGWHAADTDHAADHPIDAEAAGDIHATDPHDLTPDFESVASLAFKSFRLTAGPADLGPDNAKQAAFAFNHFTMLGAQGAITNPALPESRAVAVHPPQILPPPSRGPPLNV